MEPLSVEEQKRLITENYEHISENIRLSAEKSGRTQKDITFMAVTKTVQPVFINHALSLGIDLIGENKVQELLSKLDFLEPPGVQKHIIGHLQSNKVRKIMETVSMIQSVDSLSLAEEISRQASAHELTMDILLEVNIGNEEQKTGLSPEILQETACKIAQLEGIRLKGLMTVPPVCDEKKVLAGYFDKTRMLYEELKRVLPQCPIQILSMGMSADYDLAIEHGANLVRVGSALFGTRRY